MRERVARCKDREIHLMLVEVLTGQFVSPFTGGFYAFFSVEIDRNSRA